MATVMVTHVITPNITKCGPQIDMSIGQDHVLQCVTGIPLAAVVIVITAFMAVSHPALDEVETRIIASVAQLVAEVAV